MPRKRGCGVSSASHTNGSDPPATKRVRSSSRLVAAPLVAVQDTSTRARVRTAKACTIASRLRGAGPDLSLSALRSRYESAMQDATVAEDALGSSRSLLR